MCMGIESEKLNVRKSWYKDAPIVEWDYNIVGSTNFAELGGGCAVRTRTVSIIGKNNRNS